MPDESYPPLATHPHPHPHPKPRSNPQQNTRSFLQHPLLLPLTLPLIYVLQTINRLLLLFQYIMQKFSDGSDWLAERVLETTVPESEKEAAILRRRREMAELRGSIKSGVDRFAYRVSRRFLRFTGADGEEWEVEEGKGDHETEIGRRH